MNGGPTTLWGALPIWLGVLSGCLGGDDVGSASSIQGSFDEASGAIDGIVTDEQLLPIDGALIVLDAKRNATSDAAGSFAFRYLQPGAYSLTATKPGFANSTQTVEIRAGESSRVVFTLIAAPSLEAYHETFVQKGLLGCSATVEDTFIYYINCEAIYIAGQHSLDRHILIFRFGRLDANVSGFWAETAWTPNQLFARTLWVNWGISSGSVPSQNLYIVYPFYDDWGKSPHRQRLPLHLLTNMLKNRTSDMCKMDGDCSIISVNYAGHDTFTLLPRGIGAQFQQRFDQYLTVFRRGELPAEFSVVPDQ